MSETKTNTTIAPLKIFLKLIFILNKVRYFARNNGYKDDKNNNKKRNINEQNSKISNLQYFLRFIERLKYKLKKINIFITKLSLKLRKKIIVCRKIDSINN